MAANPHDPEQKRVREFKHDLDTLHEDWETLIHQSKKADGTQFLGKVAHDIKQLDEDAKAAESIPSYREDAKMVHYLLSTPWGASFVGESTLLEAADNFENHPTDDTTLHHLMTDFANYGQKFDTQIFRIFEDISDDLER